MSAALVAAAVGLGAGVLSGAFGVGGGVVTTPAIRLLLGYPELIAVGTPLPVILPTAIAGSVAHARLGTADVHAGLAIGLWGVPAAVAGALLSRVAGGTVVLMVTAVVIVLVAVDMMRAAPRRTGSGDGAQHRLLGTPAALGAIAGAYSGFLGLGGGFLLVPLLYRFGGFTIHRAIGTSLVAVAVLAVPGSITHWALGHVDLMLALGLTLGVVPGAVIGARLTSAAREHTVRTAFAVFLVIVGIVLGVSEAGVL